MIPFPFNENRFSFFVADHLLVSQLCTNPKSNRSLLSCLKVTQCSTSEIGDAPLYNTCSLPIQVMTTEPFPALSKGKSGLPQITGTCPGWGKQSFRLLLWSLVWFRVRATSCHFTSSKSPWKCTWMCWRVWWSGGRWQTLGFAAGFDASPQVQRDPDLASEGVLRLWTPSSPDLNPFGHTSRTSPTWPPTTSRPAWSPPSPEYLPSSRRRLWKRHAPSSGSVSRRWLRLKAATLNRCQLHYIIKLPELIFSIKVLK